MTVDEGSPFESAVFAHARSVILARVERLENDLTWCIIEQADWAIPLIHVIDDGKSLSVASMTPWIMRTEAEYLAEVYSCGPILMTPARHKIIEDAINSSRRTHSA